MLLKLGLRALNMSQSNIRNRIWPWLRASVSSATPELLAEDHPHTTKSRFRFYAALPEAYEQPLHKATAEQRWRRSSAPPRHTDALPDLDSRSARRARARGPLDLRRRRRGALARVGGLVVGLDARLRVDRDRGPQRALRELDRVVRVLRVLGDGLREQLRGAAVRRRGRGARREHLAVVDGG